VNILKFIIIAIVDNKSIDPVFVFLSVRACDLNKPKHTYVPTRLSLSIHYMCSPLAALTVQQIAVFGSLNFPAKSLWSLFLKVPTSKRCRLRASLPSAPNRPRPLWISERISCVQQVPAQHLACIRKIWHASSEADKWYWKSLGDVYLRRKQNV
jgi:hypothetical protein